MMTTEELFSIYWCGGKLDKKDWARLIALADDMLKKAGAK